MNYSLDQLNIFKTVAETGSFSAAARKLGKVQSAISMQIQNLEIDLGVTLFDRNGRYPTLTIAGEGLLKECRFIIERSERLSDLADSYRRSHISHLIIAADEFVLNTHFDETLKTFSEQFPNVAIELKFPVFDAVRQLVVNDEAHLGISIPIYELESQLNAVDYQPQSMVIVCSTDHPLANQHTINKSTLARERQVLVTNTTLKSQQWKTSPSCWFVESIWGALELCKAGVGWTILPEYAAQTALKNGKIVVLDVTDFKHISAKSAHLLWQDSHANDPALKWLINALKINP